MNLSGYMDDVGVPTLKAIKMLQILGVNPDSFADPTIFQRFKEVSEYLGENPDPSFYVSRVVGGKNVDKLDHIWGYISLDKRLKDTMKKKENVAESYNTFMRFSNEKNINPTSLDEYKVLSDNMLSINREIDSIQKEMSYYEK